MTPFERLERATEADRAAFLAIPVIRHATQAGVPLSMYLDYLGQAFHHVKHTCALLGRAAAACDVRMSWLRAAFLRYSEEERGHEAWILEDIAALGGDASAVSTAMPRPPCEQMVRRAYEGIEERGPASMLGMIYVLEGMSVLLAQKAASAIRNSLNAPASGQGFRYLTSHGALDLEHMAFFKTLVNRIDVPRDECHLIESARDMYRLYGHVFSDVAAQATGHVDAA